MLFNSLHFIIFALVAIPIHFLLPQKYRWAWLLLTSCYFYMCFMPVYILILGFTILNDYAAGLLIEKSNEWKRKFWLMISIVANCSVLAYFKYYNFFVDNVTAALAGFGMSISIPQ